MWFPKTKGYLKKRDLMLQISDAYREIALDMITKYRVSTDALARNYLETVTDCWVVENNTDKLPTISKYLNKHYMAVCAECNDKSRNIGELADSWRMHLISIGWLKSHKEKLPTTTVTELSIDLRYDIKFTIRSKGTESYLKGIRRYSENKKF
jgi:hypothetical protein